ncbi:hypothetical protein EMIHUDRAFT_448075 [Emiliania huxleyi CCMP1516]|uniref:Arrestin C-terminal-like domain-containing protein n=2 Tax=Emiliania huxleyi TaxID=2903 RepID=A0A0D3J4P8_EMIH1|nr:hypothetical protein EMIHUDRAFT_448075 [Emiliania huxleyi CCMP1516]EOD18483.1 hypothetical protein EMIHUDRAFT_448075 [Emiliania huxleyi CCMP1516]|eukprot:XP_005770912.1 hypothetical protein EMIHUDRAFT_448075 [Emiliania huxleyi CCMP1516]
MALFDVLAAAPDAWAYAAGGTVRCRLTLICSASSAERWDAPGRRCFFSSPPHVVLAGHAVEPGARLAFDVVGTLPDGLPPSHHGDLARIEYVAVLTVRMMRPPSEPSSGWRRGPICRLAAANEGLFQVRLEGAPLATVAFVGRACSRAPGEVVRGCVRFEAGGSAEEGAAAALQCSLLTISLDLEEEVECDEQLCDELGWDLALTRTEAGGTGARSSRTVESVEVAAAAVREASFELLLPSHLPPSCEAPALTLRWKLRFIFTLRPRPETEAAQTLDWVLPMTVRPAPRRSLARAAAVATPPPATLPLWLEADAPG